jgi:hypothetical protein
VAVGAGERGDEAVGAAVGRGCAVDDCGSSRQLEGFERGEVTWVFLFFCDCSTADDAELFHQAEVVADGPVLDDFSVANAEDMYELDGDRFAGWGG